MSWLADMEVVMYMALINISRLRIRIGNANYVNIRKKMDSSLENIAVRLRLCIGCLCRSLRRREYERLEEVQR